MHGWEGICAAFVLESGATKKQSGSQLDVAHDTEHVRRVVQWAKRICASEGGRVEIVVPAAYLHDCVTIPKNDARRKEASRLSAEHATRFLQEQGYPGEWLPGVFHAIEAHSFSANVFPQTLEARVVQDADRLDAIGAVGLSRCLMLGGAMNRLLYDASEPFPETRTLDDNAYTIDHFYAKLLRLESTLHTATAQQEGARRTRFLRAYLGELAHEIAGDDSNR